MPRSLLPVLFAMLVAACAAPAPENANVPVAAPETPAVADLAPQPARGEAPGQPRKAPPPTGGPLPPDVVPEKTVEPDLSCRTDADCTVKNVGNCCGYYPACVNKDSPTDPAGVQARCAADGMVSACGFPTIEGCRCIDRQCREHLQMVDGQVPPAPAPEAEPDPVDR